MKISFYKNISVWDSLLLIKAINNKAEVRDSYANIWENL